MNFYYADVHPTYLLEGFSDLESRLNERQIRQWKRGYSAFELAASWMDSEFVPRPVFNVLTSWNGFDVTDLNEGVFEKSVRLDNLRGPSFTDLMIYGDRGVIAVEAKCDESPDRKVSQWLLSNNPRSKKEQRLKNVCCHLGIIDERRVFDLYYQFLHRTASVLIEAKRRKISNALLLIHSFLPIRNWQSERARRQFSAFQAFCRVLGFESDMVKDRLYFINNIGGIGLSAAWVQDRPQTCQLG